MIYIQEKIETKLPYHFDSACVLYGAHETCQDYKLISYETLVEGKHDQRIKGNLFVGSTEFMREVFRRVGLNDVRLPRNSNRKSEIKTLSEALEISKSKNIFIKPLEIKLVSGLVLDGANYSCLNDISNDELFYIYDVFHSLIESEWRIYVHNHQIEDSRNYSGDFMLSPDYDYVKTIIQENKDDFPRTYTIDIGILEDKSNVVVEFNDMWAIGNYGVPNDIYLQMLKSRYFEIMNQV